MPERRIVMHLDELLALLGPDGIGALGEDVVLKTSASNETTTKAVITMSAESGTDLESGAGQALISQPKPVKGDVLIVRGQTYMITSVLESSDGYVKCRFHLESGH